MPRPAAPRPAPEPGVAVASRPALARPPLYRVLLHNDDYTTQEFVVFVLKTVFRKPEAEAVAVMLSIHRSGIGVAGTYPYDIAATKQAQAQALAEARDFPLRCTLEPEA